MPLDPGETRSTRRTGRTGFWLFLWFLAFYLLSTSGHIYTPDGVLMYLVTEGLVERGDPAMPAEEDAWPFWHTAPGQDGRRYAIYGLGPSLLAVPFYLVGSWLAGVCPPESEAVFEHPLVLFHPRTLPYFVKMCGVALTNAVVGAGVVWLVFASALALGFRERTALALALILGVSSPLWHYAKTSFSEPMAAFALALFLLFAIKYRETGRPHHVFAVGVALSFLLLIKVAHGVFLVAGLPLVASYVWGRKTARLKHGVLFLAGLFSLVPLILYYNARRFGTVWETGYASKLDFSQPFAEGFAGLLISPGRGLFLYFPLSVFLLAALLGAWKRERALSLCLLASFLLVPLLHAKWWSWEGGWCWGPRFFIPVLPLLVLPLGYWLEDARRHAPRTQLLWVVVLLSAVIAFSGAWVSFNDYYHGMKEHYRVLKLPYYPDLRWSWAWSPLLQYWSFEHKDFFLLTSAFSTPAGRFWQIGFGLVAAVWLTATGVLWRGVRGRPAYQPPSRVQREDEQARPTSPPCSV